MILPFTKMHGAGNDYVYVNGFEHSLDDPAAVARLVSDRHKGIGSDGLILIQPPADSAQADCRMEMYNADGSRGAMCGNGIRCVGKFAFENGLSWANPMRVATDSGVKVLDLEKVDGKIAAVTVDMGEPIFAPADIPLRLEGSTSDGRVIDAPLEVGGREWRISCVSMGNPHCVVFVDDTANLDLPVLGPPFEKHEVFPQGVNTEFIQVLSRSEMTMRVWERGSGETHACGTGACAAVVAAFANGLTDRAVRVHLLGGDLEIEWRESDGHVAMRGEAVEVYRGEIEIGGAS